MLVDLLNPDGFLILSDLLEFVLDEFLLYLFLLFKLLIEHYVERCLFLFNLLSYN